MLPDFVLPPTTIKFNSNYSAWEVSLLGKYRLPVPVLKPYVSVDPSFRAISNVDFADKGLTAALGAELKLWKLHAGSEVRFTHWGNDPFLTPVSVTTVLIGDFSSSRIGGPIASPIHTGRNQVELLFGLAF